VFEIVIDPGPQRGDDLCLRALFDDKKSPGIGPLPAQQSDRLQVLTVLVCIDDGEVRVDALEQIDSLGPKTRSRHLKALLAQALGKS